MDINKYILEFDLGGFEGLYPFCILSTAIDIFDMDGSFDVPPPLIALLTSTSMPPPPPPSLFHFLSLWGVYFHGWIVDHTHKQIIMEKFCLTSLMNYGFCNVNLELSKVKIRVCYFSVPFNFTPISLGFCINSING